MALELRSKAATARDVAKNQMLLLADEYDAEADSLEAKEKRERTEIQDL